MKDKEVFFEKGFQSRHGNGKRFNDELAKEVGINEAIIFANIDYWCCKNEARKINLHEGHYWTYDSAESLKDTFTWLSTSQIRRAIKKLESRSLIEIGNFNSNRFNKSNWYRCNLDEMDKLLRCNEIVRSDVTKSLDDIQIKTDSNSNNITGGQSPPSLENLGKSNLKKVGSYSQRDLHKLTADEFKEQNPNLFKFMEVRLFSDESKPQHQLMIEKVGKQVQYLDAALTMQCWEDEEERGKIIALIRWLMYKKKKNKQYSTSNGIKYQFDDFLSNSLVRIKEQMMKAEKNNWSGLYLEQEKDAAGTRLETDLSKHK